MAVAMAVVVALLPTAFEQCERPARSTCSQRPSLFVGSLNSLAAAAAEVGRAGLRKAFHR